jgi:peptidase E
MTERQTIPANANMLLIGGGTYAGTARPLLEMGLDLSGKQKPNVLIVPTPKSRPKDFEATATKGQRMYRKDIGTGVDLLHRFRQMPSQEELEGKFDIADVVYISGGNTRYAMDLWRQHGIDGMLDKAMRQGKVMTGISAGALSWFREGHSDSEKYEIEPNQPWNFTTVEGMGHIDALVTPHFNSVDTPDGRLRADHFRDLLAQMSQKSGSTEFGLGIDENAGILATGGLVRVVTSRPSSSLYVLSSSPDNDHTKVALDAPKFNVEASNTSASQIPEDGISWEDFYEQLGKPKK